MEVLLVAQQLRRAAPGGIGTYVRGLVGGLGPDVGVTLLAARPPVRGRDPVSTLGVAVRCSPLPGRVLTRAWDRGRSPAPDGFDVVHGPSLAAPPSPRTPLVVAVHDLAWRRLPDAFPERGRRWHEAALGRALARAAVLAVPTATTADALRSAGARPDQVEVLDPMYGGDHLPAPDGRAATALLGRLGVTGPYLLSVGTREPRKNLDRLFAAYEQARPRLPEPWPLVVVGPPGWGPAAARPPPTGVVEAGVVTGPVLAALYAGAEAVAFVPLLEGFGLPAIEAMAAGVPVVASPMPSTGGAALEVDPRDVAGMAEALVTVSTDPACRADLVGAGRERAAALTWKAAAAAHVQLWKAL